MGAISSPSESKINEHLLYNLLANESIYPNRSICERNFFNLYHLEKEIFVCLGIWSNMWFGIGMAPWWMMWLCVLIF